MALFLCALAAAPVACSSPGSRDLTPEEQQLVNDVVQLYTHRIVRMAHPDSVLGEIRLELDPATLQDQLDLLSTQPKRGQLLLEAVHDSLETLRPRLFPSDQG